MLAYQFDWPLFLIKCLWQEGGYDFCGYYVCEFIYNEMAKNKRGYFEKQYVVCKQKYSQLYFITIICVELHSYTCIDPLLRFRSGRCGMISYHKIAYEQFKRNWWVSFLTTSSIKPENTMWNLSSDIKDCNRSYIVYMLLVASDRYMKTCCSTNLSEKETSITSLCICSWWSSVLNGFLHFLTS